MSDEARLQRWLASQRNSASAGASSDHIDAEMLVRHAAGQLSGAKARMVNEHLQVCEDGRCRAFVHAELAQAAASSAVDVPPPASAAPPPPPPPPPAHDELGAPTVTAADLVVPRVASMSSSVTTTMSASRQRTFQSRAIVWSTFESMARETGSPIDELVNAAMAAYAQARGYTATPRPGAAPLVSPVRAPKISEMPQPTDPAKAAQDKPVHDPLAQTNETKEAGISALNRSYEKSDRPDPSTEWDDDLARTNARGKYGKAGAAAARIARNAKPTNHPGSESQTTAPRVSPPGGDAPRAGAPDIEAAGPVTHRMPNAPSGPNTRSSAPPAAGAGRGSGSGRAAAPATKRLVLMYQGRPFPVDKDRYLIGRSTTQSDLRLDDPNVSRQHAVIERVGAAFYIVDLGSTNGVHVGGERITRRAIADGDIVTIISHQIQCTMR